MKQALNNLKDYAELAQASYFYFDLFKDSQGIPRKIYELDSNNNKIKDESYPRGYKEIEITLEHIVSQKYCNQEVLVNLQQGDDIFTKMRNDANETFNFDKLNGEFSEIQAKNFAKRYEVIFHQPNTTSGFSATLFYDTHKDRFIVGFRGTETDFNKKMEILVDAIQDIALSLNANPQSFALLVFLKEVRKIVQVYNRPTIFVGHSLGGYLAQIALIYCDKTYKDELLFSPQEVYTFNSPSIYGWIAPHTALNPNTIKLLLEVLGKSLIDTSEKLTHIYDGGGINIIASAQYGSRNRLPIYTGKDSHSILPLTQTLYFYSYLLESNLIEEEEKSLSEYIAYCNTFNENIKTHTDTFMLEAINNSNKRNYNIKTMTSSPVFFIASFNHLLGDKPQEIDYLALFISIIYAKVHKIEALKKDRNDYVIPAITKEQIIDTIIELSENGFYIKILDKEFFATIRKQCDFINDDKNIAYKNCIAAYQNFIIIDKDNKPIETKEQLGSIYGYNSHIYKTANNEWEEIFLGASCKIIQGLYFNGKAQVAMLTS